ncbi:MAG: GAF domain-containing protein [Leifsonia sp.]
MSRSPVDAVVGGALDAIVNSSLVRHGELPVPQDKPVVHSAGPDPDRILLIGDGAVRGIGITSNDIGLGGQLARRLTPLTGRGVDIELAGTTTLIAAQAAALLDGYDTSRFDAIVLLLGLRDAVRRTRLPEWRRDMGELLRIASLVPQVFVVGIQDFTMYLDVPPLAARLIRAHRARLNTATRVLAAARSGVEYVPLEPAKPEQFVAPGSVSIYEAWADLLAPPIGAGLDPALHRVRPNPAVGERRRQKALDALGVIDSTPDPRIETIARMARELLGASGAAVTFLDHDRQWIKSAVSVSDDDMARLDSFCNTTIAKSRLFVVEDAAADPRFAGHPWVVGDEHVRFYAGYPIEAPEGVRVGALCVVDVNPRHFTRQEASLLRGLALQVQDLLWTSSRARRAR